MNPINGKQSFSMRSNRITWYRIGHFINSHEIVVNIRHLTRTQPSSRRSPFSFVFLFYIFSSCSISALPDLFLWYVFSCNVFIEKKRIVHIFAFNKNESVSNRTKGDSSIFQSRRLRLELLTGLRRLSSSISA